MELIYINIGVIILGIIGYIIWNLLKKTEKLEKQIEVQEKYILEFYDLVKQSELKIKEIDSRLYTLEKRNPAIYSEFVAKNPLYPSIVEQYQSAQGELNELRERATEIRTNKYLAIKDRDALLKLVILEQNMLKHRLVEDFKAMGLER